METTLCTLSKKGAFKLKADMLPISSLLIVINTNRHLNGLKQNFLESGFKETDRNNRICGTCKLKGTEFPALIDFTDGLKERTMLGEGYDKEFPMSIAINIDYQHMKESANEKLKKEKLRELVNFFISKYTITKILEKAEPVNKGT